MAAKVTESIYKRILQLKALGLTDSVIGERLGITPRTIRIYTRAAKSGTRPYHPYEKVDEDLSS